MAYVYTYTPRSRWTHNVSSPSIRIVSREPSQARDYMTVCDDDGHYDTEDMFLSEARIEAAWRKQDLERRLKMPVTIYEEPGLADKVAAAYAAWQAS